MNFEKLSDRQEYLACQIVDCAYKVHSTLGPGLLESIYETCFCHELAKRKIAFRQQIPVAIEYEGLKFKSALRIDVVVENIIICELKAVEQMIPLYDA